MLVMKICRLWSQTATLWNFLLLFIAECLLDCRHLTLQTSLSIYESRTAHCFRRELNFGLTELEYEGPLIPLAPPEPLLMTNVWMNFSDIYAALEYIFTKLPSTLPRLEMLTVICSELERTALPEKTKKFMHLKHLRLELSFCVLERKADMLLPASWKLLLS